MELRAVTKKKNFNFKKELVILYQLNSFLNLIITNKAQEI